jgi:hypothetical protein
MDDNGLTYDELARIVTRGREERRLLCDRIGVLEGEKAALMAIANELQGDLAAARTFIEDSAPLPG